ncbi:MAG: hypothetical protein ACRCUM_00215 [Mycoplasmoidaceae bacterium]
MKKIIKLGLLGSLIAASSLSITLPIVSCSAYEEITLNFDKDGLTSAINWFMYLFERDFYEFKGDPSKIMVELFVGEKWPKGQNLPDGKSEAILERLSFTDYNTWDKYSGSQVIEDLYVLNKILVSDIYEWPSQWIVNFSRVTLFVKFKRGFTVSNAEIKIPPFSIILRR